MIMQGWDRDEKRPVILFALIEILYMVRTVLLCLSKNAPANVTRCLNDAGNVFQKIHILLLLADNVSMSS